MGWLLLLLSGWLLFVLAQPIVWVLRDMVRCPAKLDLAGPQCKFRAGHAGRHRSPEGTIW
jgi:hypothetical protein